MPKWILQFWTEPYQHYQDGSILILVYLLRGSEEQKLQIVRMGTEVDTSFTLVAAQRTEFFEKEYEHQAVFSGLQILLSRKQYKVLKDDK